MARTGNESGLMLHPPSGDPLAGLVNREHLPSRPFSESAPPLVQ